MKTITRRYFLKTSTMAGLAVAWPRFGYGAESSSASPNETIRLGIVGLGSTNAVGGVGGRGHQLIARLSDLPGVQIVALCDVDREFLDRELQPLRDKGNKVASYGDIRRLLEDSTIDAVIVATPNHWHALATVWACQAGKDVYVEKPFSYNIWEGRQMVAAARTYARMVQVGMQNRSSPLLRRVFEDLRRGELGSVRLAHALVYRARDSIGTVHSPTPVPATVDYDLWCGPAKKGPLMRKQLHYEWHWFWDTGNGEIGNNGVHVMDLCRWALAQDQPPPRAMSIGGRFAFNDCGETANTQLAWLDYDPAPILCEIRNIRASTDSAAIGTYRERNGGLILDCEDGYFAGDASGGAYFDRQDKKIKDIADDGSARRLEVAHLSNFMEAVRTRKANNLAAEAMEGHLSAACCHMPNISHRLGKQLPPGTIEEEIRANPAFSDAFDRCREYLSKNGVDLGATPATLGPWVTWGPRPQSFVGAFADQANALCEREYRHPFAVPKLV